MHAAGRSITPFLASLTLLAACGAQAASSDAYPRVYHYTYEYNTPTLVEDHYIVLDSASGLVRGWYFGTTDDLDPGREGYPPGFFVTALDDLRITTDSITFRLHPRELFASPVPLHYRDAAAVPRDLLPNWTGPAIDTTKSYSGTVTADRITLHAGRTARVFVRQEKQP
jgi:hypothetical protein